MVLKKHGLTTSEENNMPSNYRVRTHNWIEGILTVTDQWYETLEESVAFAKESGAYYAKIYNQENIIVDKITPIKIETNSYA
jgi:hypothetical protein